MSRCDAGEMMKTWVGTLASVPLSDNGLLVEAKHARMRAYPGIFSGVIRVALIVKSSAPEGCAPRIF